MPACMLAWRWAGQGLLKRMDKTPWTRVCCLDSVFFLSFWQVYESYVCLCVTLRRRSHQEFKQQTRKELLANG